VPPAAGFISIESGAFTSKLQAQQVKPSPACSDEAHAHTSGKRGSERKNRTTRLAVQVVRLKGWLAVTEEEKCDKKLAMPFN
jgi:hypothetical protein